MARYAVGDANGWAAVGGMSRGSLGMHATRNPAGTWSFAGSVPFCLCYVMEDGSDVPDDLERDVRSFGAGLFRKAGVRCRVFPTFDAAVSYARLRGFGASLCDCCHGT